MFVHRLLLFPDNMMGSRVAKQLWVFVTGLASFQREDSLSCVPSLRFLGRNPDGSSLAHVFIPVQSVVARGWCYIYKHDRPHYGWWGVSHSEKRLVNRRSRGFPPDKPVHKNNVASRKGKGPEWVGLVRNASSDGNNVSPWRIRGWESLAQESLKCQ